MPVSCISWRFFLEYALSFSSLFLFLKRDAMATIGQLMNRDLSVITEDTTVKQAAGQMHDQRIGSLLVRKGDDFSGIVTETDVVRAVAEQDDVAATSVVHVMSSPILTVDKKLSPTTQEILWPTDGFVTWP